MKYTLAPTILSLFVFLAAGSPVNAAQTPNCQPIYGGGTSCEQTDPITINKQIQNPATQEYGDNLNAAAKIFVPGETIRFKLTLSNTGNSSVKTIQVADVFPQYIDYSRGQGKYDRATRTYTFTIDELKAKENKVFFIEGKVVSQDKLPSTPSNCIINQSSATFGDKISQDNAQLCVGKTAAPVAAAGKVAPTGAPASKGGQPIYPPAKAQTTPDTGPHSLALLGLFPLGALGFYLRTKAKT